LPAIRNGTNIREGGTRCSPRENVRATGGYAIERDGNEELKTKRGRRHGRWEREREKREARGDSVPQELKLSVLKSGKHVYL
jgi:hypothetical protein